MVDVPKPNTQAISWFYGEHEKGNLTLNPRYQRNPIWSPGQKCFLIDSIITRCPIPQVLINIRTKKRGNVLDTEYEVVDGQQRLRTILEFIGNEWALIVPRSKAYPFSVDYKKVAGKRFSDLPPSVQGAIWNYPIAVQELRGWNEKEIRSLFRRLNYVVERLNQQELRHSQYFGQFMSTVEELATQSFWDDMGVFTRRDSQRMKDVEFISELFVIAIDGVQDQQKTLDDFYARFDVNFPRKTIYLKKFNAVLTAITSIGELVKETRFSKKADFYGLFAAVSDLYEEYEFPIKLSGAADDLLSLHQELGKEPSRMSKVARKYYSTVIEGPNKLPKRKERTEILRDLLERWIA